MKYPKQTDKTKPNQSGNGNQNLPPKVKKLGSNIEESSALYSMWAGWHMYGTSPAPFFHSGPGYLMP